VKAKGKRKKVKPQTGLRLISVTSLRLTFAFLLFPFAFFSACALKPNQGGIPPAVQAAVDAASEDITEGRYEKLYNDAAEEWRQVATLEQSNETLKRLKERLGTVKSRSVHTATEQDSRSATPSGHSFTITYRSTFERADGMETFTVVERQGRWLLARYFVNSNALK